MGRSRQHIHRTSTATAPSPPAHRPEHHAWWERLLRAHEYLLWSGTAVAALWLRLRRWAGWGRFDADGKEVWGDRIPPRLRRRPLPRWQVAARRIALVATPIIAVSALLAWLDL